MFNQFIKLPEGVREKLSWLKDPFYYLYKNSGGKTLRGVLFEISKESMEKAYKRLTGEVGEIVNGDKVYMLPNCRIPLFKLKDFLSKQGAVLTDDVTEATKIIGHERAKENVQRQPRGSTMLMSWERTRFESKYRDSDVTSWRPQSQVDAERELFNSIVWEDNYEDKDLVPKDTIVPDTVWDNFRNFVSTYDKWFITPTGAWILYNHILNKVPIVNEESIYESIGKSSILDYNSWTSINDMLESKDEENQRMGAELLANCDHDKSLYWIWKLANEHGWVVKGFSRFKNVRLFIRMSKWDKLMGMIAEDFIAYMKERGVLTSEYFDDLVKEAVLPYKRYLESDLFNMVLVPSEQYKDYSNGQKFEFNKEPDNESVEIEEDEPVEDDD